MDGARSLLSICENGMHVHLEHFGKAPFCAECTTLKTGIQIQQESKQHGPNAWSGIEGSEQPENCLCPLVVAGNIEICPIVSGGTAIKLDVPDAKRKRQENENVKENQHANTGTEVVSNSGRETVGDESQGVKIIKLKIEVHGDFERRKCVSEETDAKLARKCNLSAEEATISRSKLSASQQHINLYGEYASSRDKMQYEKQSPEECFAGITAHFVGGGVSPKRLQVWKVQMKRFGGCVVESIRGAERNLTHIFATDQVFLLKETYLKRLKQQRYLRFLKYAWIEDCLKEGKNIPCDFYHLQSPFSSSSSSACVNTFKCITASGSSTDNLDLPTSPTKSTSNVEKGDANMVFTEVEGYLPGEWRDGPEGNFLRAQKQVTSLEDDVDQFQQTTGDTSQHALTTYELPDLNKHVTDILREMWNIYEDVIGDEWRSLTYRKAVTKLEKLPYRISCFEDVKNVHGIGDSMAEKIKEIVFTGQLRKLENMKADPQVQIVKKFASVWGIGPKQAQKLYQAGYRDVRHLLKDSSLSHMARIGVLYYDDLNLRIPREEVEEAEKYVQKVAATICPGISVRVTGSFRRGQLTCGDIDFLITHPDGYSHKSFLVKLVHGLQEAGFITEGVHCTDHSLEGAKHKADTFMGLCRVPHHQYHRRLDIKVYSKEVYAFALVYFTGNDVLNRRIRYAAQRKGFKLNDQGLFLRIGGKKGISSEVSIPCETEEQIFIKLGFPYYEPSDRNW